MQKSFPSVLPKRVSQVPVRMDNKSFQRKPGKHKNTLCDKISKRSSIAVPEKITWKPKREILASENWLHLIKVKTLRVINHFTSSGVDCSHSYFCIQQEFEYPVSCKAGTS